MTDQSTAPPPAALTLPQAKVEDVLAATEEFRASDFPAVPAELLASVLAAERDNLENRSAAAQAVGRAVDKWLTDHPIQNDVAAIPDGEDHGAAVS